ncbi:hypothetical protein FA13DRAFT_1195478 [Coprinellus micaceus]|uniref:Uncharacterized protein n=1 Tax=Coprinellus micaceus TaxID=71717 RepID=A0A4Y7RBM5_COPMI|nr:hypothetical protein FA13DRAFT_1195478 [Coprinellus micaceus]
MQAVVLIFGRGRSTEVLLLVLFGAETLLFTLLFGFLLFLPLLLVSLLLLQRQRHHPPCEILHALLVRQGGLGLGVHLPHLGRQRILLG